MGLKNRVIGVLPMSKRRLLKELEKHTVADAENTKRIAVQQRSIGERLQHIEKQLDSAIRRLDKMQQVVNGQEDSFRVQVEYLREWMESSSDSLRGLSETILQANDEQTRLLKLVRENQTDNILWDNGFEKSMVSANWGDVMTSDDFADKMVALMRGMDADSVSEIIKIVSRQHKYLTSDSQRLDLYTDEEKRQLRLLREEFNSQIIQLGDGLYAYKNYLLPVNHFESSVFYYKHGIHQLKHPEMVRGRDIVDVGGFIGDSILVLEDLDPGRIISFEGDEENFSYLQQTLRLNAVTNAVINNVALGAEVGVTRYYRLGSMSSSVSRKAVDYSREYEVPMTTLDAYVEEHECDIALIKVDIEGAEPLFLEGARRTIEWFRPIILLSIYHNAHDFFELKPMIESWDLGYSFSIHKPVYGNLSSETLLICEPNIG